MITPQHIEEGLSCAHLFAITSIAGVNIAHLKFDYGVDGTFRATQRFGSRIVTSRFSIDFQLKASVNWELRGDEVIYDLEAKTYNDIVDRSNDKRGAPLILILLCLPKSPSEWAEISEDHLLLRKCSYWGTFDGALTSNRSRVRVSIPRSQLFTPDILNEWFERIDKGGWI